jgi:hypothetical protein
MLEVEANMNTISFFVQGKVVFFLSVTSGKARDNFKIDGKKDFLLPLFLLKPLLVKICLENPGWFPLRFFKKKEDRFVC